jgi:hypothetical protein
MPNGQRYEDWMAQRAGSIDAFEPAFHLKTGEGWTLVGQTADAVDFHFEFLSEGESESTC